MPWSIWLLTSFLQPKIHTKTHAARARQHPSKSSRHYPHGENPEDKERTSHSRWIMWSACFSRHEPELVKAVRRPHRVCLHCCASFLQLRVRERVAEEVWREGLWDKDSVSEVWMVLNRNSLGNDWLTVWFNWRHEASLGGSHRQITYHFSSLYHHYVSSFHKGASTHAFMYLLWDKGPALFKKGVSKEGKVNTHLTYRSVCAAVYILEDFFNQRPCVMLWGLLFNELRNEHCPVPWVSVLHIRKCDISYFVNSK